MKTRSTFVNRMECGFHTICYGQREILLLLAREIAFVVTFLIKLESSIGFPALTPCFTSAILISHVLDNDYCFLVFKSRCRFIPLLVRTSHVGADLVAPKRSPSNKLHEKSYLPKLRVPDLVTESLTVIINIR